MRLIFKKTPSHSNRPPAPLYKYTRKRYRASRVLPSDGNGAVFKARISQILQRTKAVFRQKHGLLPNGVLVAFEDIQRGDVVTVIEECRNTGIMPYLSFSDKLLGQLKFFHNQKPLHQLTVSLKDFIPCI